MNGCLPFRQTLGRLFVSQHTVKWAVSCMPSRWGKKWFFWELHSRLPQGGFYLLQGWALLIPQGWSVKPSQENFCWFCFRLDYSDVTKGKIWAAVRLLLEMMHVERRQVFFPSSGWICSLAVGTKTIFVCKISKFPQNVFQGKINMEPPESWSCFYKVRFRAETRFDPKLV